MRSSLGAPWNILAYYFDKDEYPITIIVSELTRRLQVCDRREYIINPRNSKSNINSSKGTPWEFI